MMGKGELMPYSNRYLMQQMARGKPVPSGSPEEDLSHAIERLSPMDIDRAFQVGATPSVRLRGRNAFHFMLDGCLHPQSHAIKGDVRRVLECVRALVRAQVRLDEIDPATGETAAARLAWIATPAVGAELVRLISPRVSSWNAPSSSGGPSLLDVWRQRASSEVQAFLPQPSRPRVR
jgi:hypothetical protein